MHHGVPLVFGSLHFFNLFFCGDWIVAAVGNVVALDLDADWDSL